MIFVDANIPMYLIGASHPHKADAQRLLERAVLERTRLVTDAEVLQEILHRYVAIHRRECIRPAFDALLAVVDDVFPVDLDVVKRAREIVLERGVVSARDAIHVAVMRQRGVTRVMSMDRGFDAFPEVTRLG
ncbi:MAG: type II toxin-antitoxin system VapC family toxin [Myxococcota bacterium]